MAAQREGGEVMVLKPSEIVRPRDESVVRMMVGQMDAWWQSLSFEQKMSAYSVVDHWPSPGAARIAELRKEWHGADAGRRNEIETEVVTRSADHPNRR